MDNEAFRALVRKSAAPKSTKQIAREAVEGEFERRKRRRGQKRAEASRRRGKNKRAGDDDDAEDEYSDGGGGAVSSSGDEDVGDGGGDDEEAGAAGGGAEDGGGKGSEPKWKRLRREKRRKKMEEAGITQYRDRAKERRKGLNLDYQDTSALLDDAGDVDRDMSKFLGGDEKHTHLVRGLDLALAQKVRREEMGRRQVRVERGDAGAEDVDVDLDEIMDAATEAHRLRRGGEVPTTAGARRSLLDGLRPPSSVLGQSVLSHLRRTYYHGEDGEVAAVGGPAASAPSSSLAGRAIQRSTLTFSVDCNVHDRYAAWEVPRESTLSRAQHEERGRGNGADDDDYDGNFVRMTPLDDVFVGRIKAVLSGRRQVGERDEEGKHRHKHKTKKEKKKKKKKHGKMDVSDLGTTEATGGDGSPITAEDDTGENEEEEGDETEVLPAKRSVDHDGAALADVDGGGGSGGVVVDGDDSEDDIFGDAGEYVPPSRRIPSAAEGPRASDATANGSSEGKTGEKKSFFSDSPTADGQQQRQMKATSSSTARSAATLRLPSAPSSERSRQGTTSSSSRRLIDRDVIGGRREEESSAGRRSAAHGGGVSITSYAGGYGEEMDVDFDGAMEKSDNKAKKDGGRKSSKYETTASLEYGGRGKHGGTNLEGDE